MHILVVNFSLEGLAHEDYLKIADELAPVFAGVPGLCSKVWLADQENNTYGGVYTFESKQACDDYCNGELFASVGSNPNFVNVTAKTFGTIEGPTKVCNNSCCKEPATDSCSCC